MAGQSKVWFAEIERIIGLDSYTPISTRFWGVDIHLSMPLGSHSRSTNS
jgi:hypothetical protein